MTWRVAAKDAGPRSGLEMLGHVITCHRLFRALSRAQRAALLDAASGVVTAHRRVMAALEAHGLVADGRLTEAGDEIRRWNLPKNDQAGAS